MIIIIINFLGSFMVIKDGYVVKDILKTSRNKKKFD